MLPTDDAVLKAFMLAKRDFCHYTAIADYISYAEFTPKIHILAIGKAAWDMAAAALKALPEGVEDGFVLTKHGFSRGTIPGIHILEAGHPIPDEDSLRHTKRILEWLDGLDPGDSLLVLISGGGSALFEYPADGITLQDLQAFTKKLLTSGKDIQAMNRLRTKKSMVKGGKCLDRVSCQDIHVLMLSDVLDNDPRVIASGPFTPGKLPPDWDLVYTSYLHRGSKELNLQIVGNIDYLARITLGKLRKAGFKDRSGSTRSSGDPSRFLNWIPQLIKMMERYGGPLAIVMGGEMPVKVTGKGKGGRCTHLALLLAETMARYPNWRIYCIATDGNDNLPGVAGAYCDANTYAELLAQNIDPAQSLADNDSYTALKAIGNIIPARGHQTNVNDIYILAKEMLTTFM
jgi:hydroxypyruvate reductase